MIEEREWRKSNPSFGLHGDRIPSPPIHSCGGWTQTPFSFSLLTHPASLDPVSMFQFLIVRRHWQKTHPASPAIISPSLPNSSQAVSYTHSPRCSSSLTPFASNPLWPSFCSHSPTETRVTWVVDDLTSSWSNSMVTFQCSCAGHLCGISHSWSLPHPRKPPHLDCLMPLF